MSSRRVDRRERALAFPPQPGELLVQAGDQGAAADGTALVGGGQGANQLGLARAVSASIALSERLGDDSTAKTGLGALTVLGGAATAGAGGRGSTQS